MNVEEVGEKLLAAYRRHLGAAVELSGLRRLTGGAASSTWRFSASVDGGPAELRILRMSQGADSMSTGIDKSTEAKVQAAVWNGGVPVPKVIFELDADDGLAEGYVMDCIAGESIPQKILGNPEFAAAESLMGEQCARVLADIHATDVSAIESLPLLGASEQLERFEEVYRDSGQRLPVFEIALRWLTRNSPPLPEKPTLVHGDFRMGNFLVSPETGITAVLDWELAHLGNPMDDLGWLCVNSWRFGRRDKPVGGFAERAPVYAAYEAASGSTVDPDEVHYWETFGVFKWGVICMYMTGAHLSGAERSVERAAIGRRVSETEIDLVQLLKRSGG